MPAKLCVHVAAQSSDATLHGADSTAANDKPIQLGELETNMRRRVFLRKSFFRTPSEILLMKDQPRSACSRITLLE